MKTKQKQQIVNVITLGCSKNLVDSENLITQLHHNNFDVEHDSDRKAEVIIVNTCGFIDLAKQESIDTILHYAQKKQKGKIEKLYVTGCLSHRYKNDLEEEIPEVDAFFGTMELPGLLQKLNADYRQELVGERWTSTPPHFAYLKIAEGCNRTCSFCAIPLMRGNHVSQSIENLVIQAKSLAKRGVKELILISQELTYYGLDIYKKRALSELLEALHEVEGIEWIRLHYAYPSKFPLDLLDTIRELPKVCKYLDIPLQHASDNMLSAMKRQITKKETQELIEKIRSKVPDIALRTTFLVGFPGETEKDFMELRDFIEEQQFDRLGVFQYSHEEGTSAFSIEDNVSPLLKEERMSELMAVQMPISLQKNQSRIGKTMKVLVDRKESGYFYGRTAYDSPEVDNEVLIDAEKNKLEVGNFYDITISQATEYDLEGNLFNSSFL